MHLSNEAESNDEMGEYAQELARGLSDAGESDWPPDDEECE